LIVSASDQAISPWGEITVFDEENPMAVMTFPNNYHGGGINVEIT
jgi:hypothetical protein